MKILEKGEGWSIKQTCTGRGNGTGGCNSVLLVEKEDVYLTRSSDDYGDLDYFYTFNGPVCGVETNFKANEVPSSIRKDLLYKYMFKYPERSGTILSYKINSLPK